MIDFVKIAIRDKQLVKKVWKNPKLIFHSNKEQRFKDEIKIYRKKSYLGLIFTLFEDRMEIIGSLHRYFNNGKHNANDFSHKDCIGTVHELKQIFDLDLKLCFVVNLEFGLNIIAPISVKILLENILLHGRNEFRSIPDRQYSKQAGSYNSYGNRNTYKIIKAYAKGLQKIDGFVYCDYNTFRFEVKSKQSKFISNLGIDTLDDLLKPEVYIGLSKMLLEQWNEVIILDKSLPESDRRIFKFTYSDFWKESLKLHRNQFPRYKKKYFDLLKNYPDNIHIQIQDLFQTKIDEFNLVINNDAISTEPTLEDDANSIKCNFNNDANSKVHEKNMSANSIIVKMDSASERCCLVTNVPLFMQDSKSKFLTPIGLKWLFNNYRETYDAIKNRFLPRSGISGLHTKFESDESKHIAKQIRNAYTIQNVFEQKILPVS